MITANRGTNIVGLSAVFFLAAFAYHDTLFWMYDRYTGADSYYSHGFLVPLVALFFVYQQKARLLQMEQRGCVAGLYLLIFALLLHLLGTVLYIFAISGFSLFLLLTGLCLFLFGLQVSRLLWFPLVFLIFMVPLPMAMINLVSFPLKVFAAKAGVWVVGALGVPVYGEGFNIFIPAGQLLVGNPCSGLRSLIAFLALGAVFAHLAPLGVGRKWLLFFLTIPVALFSNVVRVPLLILASHYWGLEAAGPDTLIHTGSGMLVFIVGFLLLMGAAKVLEWKT
ncbi:exosortase/archaeosortase family protein [Desulfogranum mediterraneum]|uniref:exosortase/archaeosortase family protein n=1 Tax=Desulfogranum mediterraneum TaxID=160661 RepID=UPI0004095073|nr:exosortase/archaeosortase family protein [Desulfogranum mediterraneum]